MVTLGQGLVQLDLAGKVRFKAAVGRFSPWPGLPICGIFRFSLWKFRAPRRWGNPRDDWKHGAGVDLTQKGISQDFELGSHFNWVYLPGKPTFGAGAWSENFPVLGLQPVVPWPKV